MGAALRQLKRGKKIVQPSTPSVIYPVDIKEQLATAYEKGFIQGAKMQRAQDIESIVTLLEGLENIPGIGAKTAWKIQEHVMKQFGSES